MGGWFSAGESSSKTYVSDQSETSPITTSGRGAVSVRGKAPVATGEGTVAAGHNAIFNTTSTSVEDGGTQFKVGHNLTINQTADTKFLGDTLAQVLANRSQSEQSLDKVLGKIGELAEGKQTGGEASRDRTVLWIVVAWIVGVGLVLGFIFGFGRR